MHVTHIKPTYVARLNPLAFGLAEEEGEAPTPPTGLVDSWPKENNSGNNYPLRGNYSRNYQTFIGKGGKLHAVEFQMNKVIGTGDPTESHLVGNLVSKLYESDGLVPVGAALTTSQPLPVSEIGSASLLKEFLFDDTVELVNGTDYAISLEKTDPEGQIWDSYWGFINVAADIGLPASGHYGTFGWESSYSNTDPDQWFPVATQDMIFYLYVV